MTCELGLNGHVPIIQVAVMQTLDENPKGQYRKITLKNVPLWEPCGPADATEWISPDTYPDAPSLDEPYPIRPIPLMEASCSHLHVIIQPDGALWREGSLYLFERITEMGDKEHTVSDAASDLCDFMNKLNAHDRDFLDFDGPKFKRPTYFYKSELKKHISSGERSKSYCNRKIGAVQGMYRWLVNTRGFKPKQNMWESKSRFVNYTDRHGVLQTKEVISTDLTFRNSKSVSTGRFIQDGGNLIPLSKENQQHLLDALVALENPEMLLMHLVGITSGMRTQSISTLRRRSVKRGVGHASDEYKFALYGIEMGEGHLVEAKNGKEQTVMLPAWVHNMLEIYINSPRHQTRAKLSPIQDPDDQYVFLTRTGKPYYVAKVDQKLFNYSTEKGSALRQFCRKVIAQVQVKNKNFTYHLHDLRATFGMNLLNDDMKKRDEGKMNQLEILDHIRNRLNHEDINVTMNYLRFYDENPELQQAQSDFEIHLESLVRTEMLSHEKLRPDLP